MKLLTITLRPHWEDGTVAYTSMDFSFPADGFTDSPQIKYENRGFGGIIVFPEYDNLYIKDDLGDLAYELKDAGVESGVIEYKGIYFARSAKGTVKWGYRLMPRELPEGYRSSPYFDFRSEPGGMNGLGFFSFMLPPNGTDCHLKLHWDLSEMPEEARGVFWYSPGDFELDTNTLEIRFGYYASGVMNSIEEGDFGVYWFGAPDFDVQGLAERLKSVFQYYSKFFHDENAIYRIFLRRDPFEYSGGGTAGTRSFLSGYSAIGSVDVDKWFSTLVHEILHNWPFMDDTNYGDATWYNEGCAEYFSTILPLRAGITDLKYAVEQINNKVGERYLDVLQYRELSNMEVAEVQWKDRIAQSIPYGRGCLYLANTDAEMRRRGKGSIDDIISLHDKKNHITLDEWKAFIEDRLGQDGLDEFEKMKAGNYITPDPDAFDGKFDCYPVEMKKDGKTFTTYRWRVRN